MVAMSQVDIPQMQFIEAPVGVVSSRTQLNFADARAAVNSVGTAVAIVAGVLSFAYVAGSGDFFFSSWIQKFVGVAALFAAGTLLLIALLRAGTRLMFDRLKARNLSYVEERAAVLQRVLLEQAGWVLTASNAFSFVVHRQGELTDADGVKFQAYGAAFTDEGMTATVALKDEVVLAHQKTVAVESQAEYAVTVFESREHVVLSDVERRAFMNGFIHRARLSSGSEVL